MADMDWPVHHGLAARNLGSDTQHLRARGILVAVCSKNDRTWCVSAGSGLFILGGFRLMILCLWKSAGGRKKGRGRRLRLSIEAASLTPKSVVLVDDNPVERESVKAALPGERPIGDNPYATRRILLCSAETQVPWLMTSSFDGIR